MGKPLSVCMVKEMKSKIVLTKCLRDTTIAHATVWASLVTCADCLAGRTVGNEHDEAMEALLR